MKRIFFTSLLVMVMVGSVFATGLAASKVLHMYTAFDTEEAKYYTLKLLRKRQELR